MNVIKELGFLICITMILMVYLKQMLPAGKNGVIVKGIISVFVLLSIVTFFTKTDWMHWDWQDKTVLEDGTMEEAIAEGLKDECNRFLKEQNIDAAVIELKVEQNDGIEIIYLCITGAESDRGKQLLSARYQIDYDRIEVKDEN